MAKTLFGGRGFIDEEIHENKRKEAEWAEWIGDYGFS